MFTLRAHHKSLINIFLRYWGKQKMKEKYFSILYSNCLQFHI
jgi:hypothetical protein